MSVDEWIKKFTWSNRIFINELFSKELKEIEYIDLIQKEFNLEYDNIIEDIENIQKAAVYFVEKEKIMFKSQESETSSIYHRYFKDCGELPTIIRVAKDFGKDIDEVLQWKYEKVIGILYVYQQEGLYEAAVTKYYKNKSKLK